jgi:hypothetical protein
VIFSYFYDEKWAIAFSEISAAKHKHFCIDDFALNFPEARFLATSCKFYWNPNLLDGQKSVIYSQSNSAGLQQLQRRIVGCN